MYFKEYLIVYFVYNGNTFSKTVFENTLQRRINVFDPDVKQQMKKLEPATILLQQNTKYTCIHPTQVTLCNLHKQTPLTEVLTERRT